MLGIVGLPVPDETLLTFVGYLVYKGKLRLVPSVVAAFLGSICGITLSYGLGSTFGFYLIHKYGPTIHITEDKVNQVHKWFNRMGKWSLMFGYFLPGVRHLTAYVAGTSKLEFHLFALFAYLGGFIWSVTFIALGYFFGEGWAQISERLHHKLLLGSGIVIALLLFYFLLQKGRRKQK